MLASGPQDLVPPATTDVIVLSHGWKNDRVYADALYAGILKNVRHAAGDSLRAGGRTWAAVGVYWPAFWFRPDLSLLPGDGTDGDGQAAGIQADDLAVEDLRAYAAELAKDFGDRDADGFVRLVVQARAGGGRADAMMDHLRGLLTKGPEAETDVRDEHVELLAAPGSELHVSMRDGGTFSAASFDDEADPSRPVGGAASFERVKEKFARLRSGGAAAVARLLNQATYYEMKARAGRVGAGLARELDARLPEEVRLHLVGHSFGGRVVTSAAASDGMPAAESLSLLQAAFSHNGLGTGFGDARRTVGSFRKVIEERRVAGPILVTHTHRDTAVGFFYALASKASGTIASSYGLERLLGGPTDPHGGMGANGTQSMLTDEAVAHVAGDMATLTRGKVNNVLSDAIVADHNDVANEGVGALVWQAVSAATENGS